MAAVPQDGTWPGLKVRIAFTANAGSTLSAGLFTDMSTRVRSFNIRRGPFDPDGVAQPGRATVRLDNRDGAFDPLGAGTYSTKVGPGVAIDIHGIAGGTTYPLFTGYIDEWTPKWDTFDSEMTITAVDRLGIAAQTPIQNTTGFVGDEEDGESRLIRIMNAIDWSTAELSAERGNTLMQPTTFNESALSAMKKVATAEGPDARLYIGSSGWIVFKQRDWLVRESAGAATTLADSRITNAAPTNTFFRNPAASIGRGNVINHSLWRIANAPSDSTWAVAEAASTASTSRWGRIGDAHTAHTASFRDLPAFAAWTVARGTNGYKNTVTQEIKSIQPVPQATTGDQAWKRTLDADLTERVRLKWKPPHSAGTTYTEESRIVGIEHQVTASPRQWDVTLTMASASFDSTGTGSDKKARDVFQVNNSDLADGTRYWGP